MADESTRQPNRRSFIGTAAASTVCLATTCLALPSYGALPLSTDSKRPWFEISLAQWSLHRSLFEGKITNLDFPRVAKEKFGIAAVEYVNQFFKDKAEDAGYLAELNKRCEDVGVQSLLIMVDREGNLGDPNAEERAKTVQNHRRWVTAAKALGCHSIRVNASSKGDYQEQVKLAADGLRSLSEFAAPLGINVIVENHGGLSSNGQWLAQVIQRVNLDNCGTLPDFGNFRINQATKYDPYLGMAAMMPFAKAVSAKSHDFDKAGNESATDYHKMLTIVRDAGYRGFVGVEYEGKVLSEEQGIIATRDLLIKCRDELAV